MHVGDERDSLTRRRGPGTVSGTVSVVVSLLLVAYTVVTDPLWPSLQAQMRAALSPPPTASAPTRTETPRPDEKPFTRAQLNAAQARVVRQGARWLDSVYVDASADRVVAAAQREDLPGLKDALYGMPEVRIEEAPGAAYALSGPVGIPGGAGIVGGSGADAKVCSLGFNAWRGTRAVFLTAGHCAEGVSGFRSASGYLGRTAAVTFPGADFAYAVSAPAGRPDSPGATGTVRRVAARVPVRGSAVAPIGARVCKSGAATGWTCGRILARDVTLRVRVSAGRWVFVSGLTKASACSTRGDSGGPWMWGTQAQGLTSAAITYRGGVCGSAVGRPTVSYFQPIRPALKAYGLRLRLA